MIKETDLDAVISELRLELERVDRAILVFERMAAEMTRRRRFSRASSVRLKRTEASQTQSPANPS